MFYCCWVWVSPSSSNARSSATVKFFGGLTRFSFLKSKLPLLNHRNQSLHSVWDRALSPYAPTNKRWLSGAFSFQWKKVLKDSPKTIFSKRWKAILSHETSNGMRYLFLTDVKTMKSNWEATAAIYFLWIPKKTIICPRRYSIKTLNFLLRPHFPRKKYKNYH